MVFIDGAYLAKVLKSEFGETHIDFEKFSNLLCKEAERLRTYYYNCMPYQSSPPTPEERKRYSAMDKFIYTIRRLPRFEVRLGRLSNIRGKYIQKRVDVMLAVDLVRMSWGKQIHRGVLVTGDSDFVPAIKAARDAGVLVQLYYSEQSYHDELISACDECFEITEELIKSAKPD